MWSRSISLWLATVSSFSAAASDFHWEYYNQRREYVDGPTVSDSYDFIIAGGGLAGLVIASRLTEDPHTTVLVIEAGESGDAVAALSINPPSGTYYNSLVGTSYDWGHQTEPQRNAGDRIISWPRGKVLGGSSAINGMYYIRPSELEVNAWNDMLQSVNGTTSWAWDNFLTAMKKSETFISPSDEIQDSANIIFNRASYGDNGPIMVTYPGFLFSPSGDWIPSLKNLGINSAGNPNGGENYGAFVSTVSINPKNWTRSYSKSGYIDPFTSRRNLHILVSTTVSKVIFGRKSASQGHVATGVEIASTENDRMKIFNVKKEVILAGGALGSPHILLSSGVGPKDVLADAGVSLVSELPGVGEHLQDHISAPVIWKSLVQTAGDLHATGSSFSEQPVVLSSINSATAYVNASMLFGNTQGLQDDVRSVLQKSLNALVPSKSKEVIEGYKSIYHATETFLSSGLGQIELLLSLNSPGSIQIQAALQHPFSQGHVYINSSSAFGSLVIDPQYFSHPTDVEILREGVKLARRVGQMAPLKHSLGEEKEPGPDVTTDDQIEEWLRKVVSTEYHPTATCAMLPEAQGGVVDANLQVYGLANVRVADSSVFPLAFSAHLGAATYGLAEAAADIIKVAHLEKNASSSGSEKWPGPKVSSASARTNEATINIHIWTLGMCIIPSAILFRNGIF